MTQIYVPTSVSGYNANPPPDDGTQVPTNQVTWNGTIKSKIGDPLNTAIASIDSNVTAAVGKLTDGAAVLAITTNYTVGAADQGKLVKVTNSGVTITTPDAGTVGAPFMFHVLNDSSGTITIAGNATNSQTFDGQTSQVIQPGSGCALKTDGTNWFSFGLKSAQITSSGSSYGFGQPINMALNASVGSNLLTVAIKTLAGNDPSAGDPVLIPFRNAADANGTPTWVTLTSALSISTNATGATLGTSNNVPFRFWIVVFNNGGTPVLALINCSTSTQIYPLNQNYINNATGISSAATSAGVFYCPNGTTITNKPFHILGFAEYSSGLATAGSYASAPNFLEPFGSGCKLPGDIVQAVSSGAVGTTTALGTGNTQTAVQVSISPTSSANPIRLTASVEMLVNNALGRLFISRGTGPTQVGTQNGGGGTSVGQVQFSVALSALDIPNTTSSTTYYVYGISSSASNANVNSSLSGAPTSEIWATEIMG